MFMQEFVVNKFCSVSHTVHLNVDSKTTNKGSLDTIFNLIKHKNTSLNGPYHLEIEHYVYVYGENVESP